MGGRCTRGRGRRGSRTCAGKNLFDIIKLELQKHLKLDNIFYRAIHAFVDRYRIIKQAIFMIAIIMVAIIMLTVMMLAIIQKT
ncbi:MAG: hypothetical protein WAO23_05155 [Dethiobacteria bacterium]